MDHYSADPTPAIPTLLLAHRVRTHLPDAGRELVREKLGTWKLPLGGKMDLYLEGRGTPICEWPELPLCEANHRYYVQTIVPDMAKRIKACLGLRGNGLWVLL